MQTLMEEFLMALRLPLYRNALIVGVLVSVCAAALGVVLVLKKYSMIGHGLGEVGFFSMTLAALVGLGDRPLLLAIPLCVLAAVGILVLNGKNGMSGDALVGMISTGALAAGVILQSLVSGFKQDVYSAMFGSIYGMTPDDVILSVVLSAAVILVFALMFNRLFSVTYDEVYARASGVPANLYQFILSTLTAVTVVVGMRMMGAMLISSFILFPALTARGLTRSFKGMVVAASLVSLVSFLGGMIVSFLTDLPTGACIVGVSLVFYFISLLIRKVRYA